MNRSIIDSSLAATTEAGYQEATSALHAVAGHLEAIRESDDFQHRLTQNDNLPASGLGDRYYTKGHEFSLSKNLPIPPELLQQMNNTRSRFEMGLFPEIGRAWVTIDCDIFMWNYETNDDLAYFDGIPNTVVKIALAKPRPGVFQSHVHWLLVVGTVVDVVILAVSTNGGELAVIPEPLFKVDVENALVNDIVSTTEGRIFFTGNDVLFELEYSDKGWFHRQCKKVNRSTNLLMSLVPFLSPVAEDIEQIVVDNSRHILYALTKKSSIQVFDLGSKGTLFSRVSALTIGQITHAATTLSGGQHDPAFFSSIVRISALEAKHSHNLHLIGVTSKGVRLYFSVLPKQPQPMQGQYVSHTSMTQAEARPQCLRVSHVRFSPGVCPTSIYRDCPQGVYMSFVDSSTCVMATSVADSHRVWALSDLYHPNSRFFVEAMNELVVSGPIWAIASTSNSLCSSDALLGDLIEPAMSHPFFRMHAQTPEQLVVFTSEGLHIFEHTPPMIALRDALFDKGSDGAEVARLWQQLGPTNTLVLVLMLLASEKPVDQNVRDRAVRLFFSWKDEPEMVDSDVAQREWREGEHSFADWSTRMRSPLLASTPFVERAASPLSHSPIPLGETSFVHGNAFYQFRPSKRHDALFAYFSRLVASVWNHPLTVLRNGRLHPLVNEQSLEWLSNQLRLLLAVIDEHGLIPKSPSVHRVDHTINTKFGVEAIQRERLSLLSLRSLIIRAFETLSLWAVAVQHGMTAVSASIEAQTLALLNGRRLCDLCTSDTHLNAELIKALIKYFLGDEAGTRELSDRLRNVCPTLYSQDDALVTNATEMVERAAKLGSGLEARRLIESAVALYKQSVHKLPLSSVCNRLAQLHAYDSIVELCILRAKRDDPKQLAHIAYRNGLGDGDREMAEAVNRRDDAYRVFSRILDTIEEAAPTQQPGAGAEPSVFRDQVIQAVLASDDELAHAALFRWLLHNNKSNLILQSKSTFVEQFLTHEIGRGGGHKYLDLLWRFYERANMFDKAARLLTRMADNSSHIRDVTLSQRISYLSHAIMCAQSAQDPQVKATIQDMRDKLEVANIQMSAKETLEQLPSADCRKAARDLDRRLVDLQELCVNYARKYNLWRIQLAIFRSASYYEAATVQTVWVHILQQEFDSSSGCIEQRLLTTLADLAQLYAPGNYFPMEFIVVFLLSKCFECHVRASFFVDLLPRISLTTAEFVDYLMQEYRLGDPFWRENANARRFLVDVTVAVIEDFVNNAERLSESKRDSLVEVCASCISMFEVDTRSVASAPQPEIEQKFIILKERLARLRIQ